MTNSNKHYETRNFSKQAIVDKDGFIKKELTISAGQSVIFGLASRQNTSEKPKTSEDAENEDLNEYIDDDLNALLEKASIVQVIPDEIEEKFIRVLDGHETGTLNSNYTIRFKLAGVYLFKLINHPRNPPPIRIKVLEEQPFLINITEDGFLPRIIKIDEGTSVEWSSNNLSFPHSIYEAEYCDSHGGVYRITDELVRTSLSLTYIKKFDTPGLYYFQTQAKNSPQMHCCIVEVQKANREYLIEIFDKEFSPARITIEEGDKVWFNWSSKKVMRNHQVYQIHPPSPDHPTNQAYIAVKNGFKWNAPSRNGMLSHTFDKSGVYYYSDLTGKNSALNIGIIAVKKKPKHHVLRMNEDKKTFGKEIIIAQTGDLIWWKWNKLSTAMIRLYDANLVYDKKIATDKCKVFRDCEQLEANAILKTGIYFYRIKKPGCYYFLFKNENTSEILTLLATSSPKDHKLIITDNEGIPNILNIHPEDRVWFVWDNTKREHNIRQVNHQNQIISNGFLSGAILPSPAAFVLSFTDLGIFYYRSDNSQGTLGAIVVVPEPQIEVVNVMDKCLIPDPVIINVNDVVVWEFNEPQNKGLVLINSNEDLLNYVEKANDVLPTKFLSKSFKEPGVFHFASPSFDRALKKESNPKYSIINTVIVDVLEEHTTIFVDKDGFYPELVNVQLGKSVLFDWSFSNQAHNIVHVQLPNDKKSPLKVIEGPSAFNSGAKVMNNTFLHTFEEEGMYCVVSDGADYTYCIIKVIRNAKKTSTPKLVNEEPYAVHKFHKMYLNCNTKNAFIHFTTDGTIPTKRSLLYNHEKGIVLREEGFNIIRAIAYSEKYLTSDIFTSSRFLVKPDPKSKIVENQIALPPEIGNKDWWACIPRISYKWTHVSCIELSWTRPRHESLALISHYKIFLNNVSYRNYIKATTNKVEIKGLAGGKNYDINVVCYPKKENLVPQESNTLTAKVPRITELGGPIISLKANTQRNQITICWLSIDTSRTPIIRYDVLVNGERKEKIKAIHGKHTVVIDGCQENTKYIILVVGISKCYRKNETNPLISNELEVMLPLEYLSEISLPEPKLRTLDDDYYDEYVKYVVYQEPKPQPPKLRARSVGLYTVTLEWIPETYYKPELIIGYRLIINEELDKVFENNVREFMFTNMKPGEKYDVQMVTLTKDLSSKLSNKLTLVCPLIPPAPSITKLQSLRPSSATVGWKITEPRSINGWDNIASYQIYLNNVFNGEIAAGNLKTFTYQIGDLEEGNSYGVSVQAWCGEKLKEPVEGPIVSCLVASDFSNNVSLVPAAPPDPPILRIVSISPDGIEITWDDPQEYGEAYISGFQVVKDGGLYGSIIPPKDRITLVGDCVVGETVNLQMISLTNHPCGKYVAYQNDIMYTKDHFEKDIVFHPDYPACQPGPMISVKYIHLVKPAVKVWSENITSHAAMILYQIGKTDHNWIVAEYYLISFWTGNKEETVQTLKTQKDFVQLLDLEPNTEYCVQVESRAEASRYYDYYKTDYRYTLYSRSNIYKFRTDSPLGQITSMKLAGTICHALKVKWNPPIDPGSELVAQRIDCVSTNNERPSRVFKELSSTTKSCIIDNLDEKTEYKLTVTAITESFLKKHPKIFEIQILPKEMMSSMPKASIEAFTSGCDSAYHLRYKMKSEDRLLIKWKRAKTYGSTKLIYQILCYQSMTEAKIIQVPLSIKTKEFELENLRTGTQYKIWIESVILIKLNIDSDDMKVVDFKLKQLIDNKQIFSTNLDHYKELKEYRCTNVLSEALPIRI